MTPTRWLIVAFWVVVLGMCAKGVYDYNNQLDNTPKAPERHWFPAPLPSNIPPQSENADVRLVRYVVHEAPQATSFTVDLVLENYGKKKAVGIQVRLLPYHGIDATSKEQGPDEVANPHAADSMATSYQWTDFQDLNPGETGTKTLTFPERSDAEPRVSYQPQITFETSKDNP
jgi:hypothetical protein